MTTTTHATTTEEMVHIKINQTRGGWQPCCIGNKLWGYNPEQIHGILMALSFVSESQASNEKAEKPTF
jgi:hypothetical protein